jgi:hypothetical protein
MVFAHRLWPGRFQKQCKNLSVKARSGKKSLEKTVFSAAIGRWVSDWGMAGKNGYNAALR